MSSACKHGNYVGDNEGCGLCAGEARAKHRDLLYKARFIVKRCGDPSGKSDKYTWPDGELSHCTDAVSEDNCYAEPGGAICPQCVEALLNLLEGK